MGRLYDSLKQRGGTSGLPAASSMAAAAPRLQVIPASSDLPSVDNHEEMPSFEVPFSEPVPAIVDPASSRVAQSGNLKKGEKEKRRSKDLSPQAKLIFSPHEESNGNTAAHHIASQIVVVHEPQSVRTAEYRELASQLSKLLTQHQSRSLTLLPIEAAGSSAILTANLGYAWAEFLKHPIILIDAARPSAEESLAALLGLGTAPGWEELMTGAQLSQTIQQTGRAWLDVITAGHRLSFTGSASWAKKTGSILHTLSKHYKTTILLGPAYPHSPLGLVLAESSDSTCILVAADQVNHPHKDALRQTLTNQAGHVLGTIVVDT